MCLAACTCKFTSPYGYTLVNLQVKACLHCKFTSPGWPTLVRTNLETLNNFEFMSEENTVLTQFLLCKTFIDLQHSPQTDTYLPLLL